MSSGCGCKEVYRIPHITYPYSSCICSFAAASHFLFIKKARGIKHNHSCTMMSLLVQVT